MFAFVTTSVPSDLLLRASRWSELKRWATVSGEFERKLLANTSLLQYMTFQFFAVSVLLAMPVKLIFRLCFTIKYVWVTPFFNV